MSIGRFSDDGFTFLVLFSSLIILLTRFNIFSISRGLAYFIIWAKFLCFFFNVFLFLNRLAAISPP
ncbi:MAG: hypothetical protein UW28_C0013G0045 [Parcubacteria group bacterium GW2011_GWA2_44_13]|nr:MAG: hypothetical protein UW28_C0013G0045 [Parcubacteria group bacterium GW2011_GWA2_44_13]